MHAEKITPIHEHSPVIMDYGVIESTNAEDFRIQCHDRHYDATRAFGCLLEPQARDTVLFSIDRMNQCHILSIISRPEDNGARLAFPGDVTLDATQGKLQLNAKKGVNITSPERINQVCEEFTLMSKKTLISSERISAIGSKLVAKIGNVQTIADSIETIADNLLQKLKNSFRLIQGVDQSRSHDVINTVDNLYSVKSTQSAIIAKKDMKIDAERIHMG